MPYVEGETLRDRLARTGELPVPEAVRLLGEIADALAVAHRAGVVHRDIKPENILLSGRHAMVMDFGIAKAVSESAGQQLTTAGVALGTPAYMAPEQAAAEPTLDHRVDIYALGVLGYELLTGQPPFTGGTAQQILAAQVTRTPEPISGRRPSVPPALAAAIMKCLEKRPADRYQTTDELMVVLEPLAMTSGGTTPTALPPVADTARRFAAPALIAALAVVVVGLLSVRALTPRPFTLTTSNAVPVTSEPGIEFQPALSPDGSEVAYITRRNGRSVVSIRSASAGAQGGEIRPAESEQGNQAYPGWTSDGESVRFTTLPERPPLMPWREVGRLGGASRVDDLPRASQWTAWSRDNKQVAYAIGDSIFIYAVGARSTRLLAVDPDPNGVHSLAWSPDSRWIAYVIGNPFWPDGPNTSPSGIWLVSTGSGERVRVTGKENLNVSPAWADAGTLLFVSNRDGLREIYAVEIGHSGPRGEVHKVPGGSDAHSISVSADGRRLAYAKMSQRANVRAWPLRPPAALSLSDGRGVTAGNQRVETFDLSGDGQWLLYDSNLRGTSDIYKLKLEGGEPIPLVTGPGDQFGPRWSPDGREFAYYGDASNPGIWIAPADGGTPARLSDTLGFSQIPMWAPDGLMLSYWSSRSGNWNVWYVARTQIGGPWGEPRLLTDFGCFPTGWAPGGSGVTCLTNHFKELVKVSRSGKVLWRRDLVAAGFTVTDVLAPVYSEDGISLYLRASRGAIDGIWAWALAGGEPRLVLRIDDPSLKGVGFPGTFGVSHGRLFLVATETESDIWVVDLKR